MAVVLLDHDPRWVEAFSELGATLRVALGHHVRLHHIGSTAVPGLVAKPVVDVQVGVLPGGLDEAAAALEGVAGLAPIPGNPDGRKRFLRRRGAVDDDGLPLVDANVHVRVAGEFSAQAALLLRDHLRAEPAARAAYGEVKLTLARRRWPSVDDYAEAKGDVVWALLRAADRWAWQTAWAPPPSDA